MSYLLHSIKSLGPTDEVDHTAVGAAITTITSNLPEVTKGNYIINYLQINIGKHNFNQMYQMYRC